METRRTLEELLEAYCRDGATAAVAELFDRAAPELLRVACHVTSDLASAEDLLQQTFLSAIESAARFERGRRVVPWLLGILANHARAARRAGSRFRGSVELAELDPVAPGVAVTAAVGAREVDTLLQREIEQLHEPYREVVRLTLHEGLAPHEVARSLGRAPGTVRVQLHRALELLRRRLPRGASLALLVGGPSGMTLGSGLACVRAAVLERGAVLAARSAAATASAGAIVSFGGLVMGKKLVVAAACALVAAAGWFGLQRIGASGGGQLSRDGRALEHAAAAAPQRTDVPAADVVAQRVDEAASRATGAAAAATPIAATLRGGVFAADSRAPLAGATIAFFAPVAMTLETAARKHPQFLHELRPLERLHFSAHWLAITPSARAQPWPLDLQLELCAPPEEGAVAVAQATASIDGGFELALPLPNGIAVVRSEGYETQWVPVVDATAFVPVALHRLHRVEGRLVDAQDAPIAESVELLFEGHGDGEEWLACGSAKRVRPRFPGPWLVRTDSDGTFEAEVGARWVTIRSATPGLEVSHRIVSRAGRRLNHDASFEVPRQTEPLVVVVRRNAVLTLLDAETREPVETFGMLARAGIDDAVVWNGHFHATRGRVALPTGPKPGGFDVPKYEPLRIHVWSERHGAAFVQVPASDERRDLEVLLEAGALPSVAGVVVRGGEPASGVAVRLAAFRPISWSAGELEHVVASTSTDELGRFELHAPPGRFLLAVGLGDATQAREIAVPSAGPVRVDLAAGGVIEALVLDPRGAARADMKVAIHAASGEERTGFTDAGGRVRFEGLAAGEWRVSLHGDRGEHVAIAQALARTQVAGGGTAHVELVAPPAGPITLRIVAAGTSEFTGWRARRGVYAADEWVDVRADGVIDADACRWPAVEIASPARVSWNLPLSAAALARGIVEIPAGDVGYRGRLLDGDSGVPLADVEVRATATDGDLSVTALTDAEGAFVLPHLPEPVGKLALVLRDGRHESEYAHFEPAQPPVAGGRELLLRAPALRHDGFERLGRRSFRGRLVLGAERAPIGRARLWFTASFPDDDGTWSLACAGGWDLTHDDGTFVVTAPKCASYDLSVRWADNAGTVRSFATSWNEGADAAGPIEVVVD